MYVEFLVAMCAAVLTSVAACRLVMAAGVVDEPTIPRKMHKTPTPTPTSGGIGIATGFAVGVCILLMPPVQTWSRDYTMDAATRMAATAAAAILFFVIGVFDDLKPMRAREKMIVFILGALAAALLVGKPDNLPIGAGAVIPLHFWGAVIGAALWVFVVVNAVNFLDGANGLSMGSVAIGLICLAIIALDGGARGAAALSMCGAAALIGFLFWNFPAGRLFAGDSGALFAGGLAAAASLLAVQRGGVSPFTVATLFLPLVADALLTLFWRATKARELFDGHRDHIYQIALRAGWPHKRVTYHYWVSMMVCGLIAVAAHILARGMILPLEFRGGELEDALTYAPFLSFVCLLLPCVLIFRKTRRYAKQAGLDAP
ncbi:MAG: hypothetical protein ABW199_08530 [Caulobacterales bacterium]